MQLAQSNFIYRHPKLAEDLRRPTAAARAQRWVDLIDQHHPSARTVVDLGCWIGLDAEQLAHRYAVVGVDVQPHLIDYARRYRRGPDFHVGDLTSIRLGRSFDVILCVGNSLSYVHDAAGLDRAFATFSAHAQHGSLLILHTLLAPIADGDQVPRRIDAAGLRATYTEDDRWSPLTHLLTTRRTWRHDDGATEVDVLQRRVLPAPELELRAGLAGWDVLHVEFDPPEHAGDDLGAVGCLVARFRRAGAVADDEQLNSPIRRDRHTSHRLRRPAAPQRSQIRRPNELRR